MILTLTASIMYWSLLKKPGQLEAVAESTQDTIRSDSVDGSEPLAGDVTNLSVTDSTEVS